MRTGVEHADDVRVEHDMLGDHAVPAGALYGIHTVRARANFRITGDTLARYLPGPDGRRCDHRCRGEYDVVHPLEHVNLGQSTNDVYPTAVRLALPRAAGELLQLNAFGPVIARSLLDGAAHLAASVRALAERCVAAIMANREHLADLLRDSLVTVTHLSPVLGNARASELAVEAGSAGGGVLDLAVRKGLLDDVQARQIKDAAGLVGR